MELLRKQMHYVAIGEYDKVTPIEGTDEIAELYREVEKMRDDNRELMKKIVEEQVQKEKIHTAIETSFYTSLELIKKALPYLDLVYIDLKIFDEQKHQACTNVSPQLIKENIRYVLQSEYKDKVIIRTPLIPTMSATDENIKQIVQFLIQINPEVKYEMLNYNPLASAKYELVNLKYGLESYQMFTKQQMQHFYDVALQAGIKNLIKE